MCGGVIKDAADSIFGVKHSNVRGLGRVSKTEMQLFVIIVIE